MTFPDPALASANFATFALPGGDTVTVAATGLSADRIRIATNVAGLTPGGGADAFYLFSYTQFDGGGSSSVPEPGTAALLACAGAMVIGHRGWRRRRHS